MSVLEISGVVMPFESHVRTASLEQQNIAHLPDL